MLAVATVPKLELLMRFLSLAAAGALALVSISTSLQGQPAREPVSARSLALVTEARGARSAGNLDTAVDLLETAVAVDPRNRPAFVLLADIAAQRGLPGKAIRLYREALALDPNDLAALRGQGKALVAKGAVERAKENLAKIRTICRGDCPQATELSAVIAKGPPVAGAQASAVPPTRRD